MDKTMSFSQHFAAIVGAVGLHTGIAAWAVTPSEPLALPQQQVIQISMVAPLIPVEQEVAIVEPIKEPETIIPPKEEGLRKVQPEPEKQVEKKPSQKVQHKPSNPPTSGPQDQNAVAKNAAITEPVFDAAYLRNPAPEYPEYARRRGLQGKVLLEVQVTREGDAKEVNIAKTSGFNVLDKAALKVVRHWKFVPARRGSEFVEAGVLVPVEFRIN